MRLSVPFYNGNDKVLGLFTPGNMTTEWNGTVASAYPSNTADAAGERCGTTTGLPTSQALSR